MSQICNTPSVCPLCMAVGFRSYKSLGLVQCESCSLVLSPLMWQAQANEKMEDEWFGQDYQAQTSIWVNMFEAWNNRKTLARLKQANPIDRRLLEIGVGSGSLLNMARAIGYDVMGCDLSSSICEHVRREYGITMHSEHLGALTGENRFDIIVMNHVLEHSDQPIALLMDVHRLLAPGGVVHIAVPNIACWEANLSGWSSYEPYHLAYFDLHTLEKTVTAVSLTIDCIATHDSFSGWFLAILRTALGVNREGGAVTRPASAIVGIGTGRRSVVIEHAYRLAMVCAGVGLLPLRLLQAKLGRGDEIICIARKPFVGSAQ